MGEEGVDMEKSPRSIVFEGMELLPAALTPFVEQHLKNTYGRHWRTKAREQVRGLHTNSSGDTAWDQAGLLKAMKATFALDHAERSIVSELLEARNRLAHNDPFGHDDAERALDSMRRLCDYVGAEKAAAELRKMRSAILRMKYQEQARNEEVKDARPEAESDEQSRKRLVATSTMIAGIAIALVKRFQRSPQKSEAAALTSRQAQVIDSCPQPSQDAPAATRNRPRRG